MRREAFLDDRRTQQAVAMNLLIVGEVAAKLLDRPPERIAPYPDIPWASMKGMRNRIAHGYFEIDKGMVRETVQSDLPDLIACLIRVIDAERSIGRRIANSPAALSGRAMAAPAFTARR